MRISGGAVPAREIEVRMFEWLARPAKQTDQRKRNLSGISRALEAGAERALSTTSPVEEEIVGTVQRLVGG